MDTAVQIALLEDAIAALEKVNANLEPGLVSEPDSKTCMSLFARAHRLAAFGVTAFARKQDAAKVARVTGTSMGKAKDMVATSEVLGSSGPLNHALRHGEVSLDQATEIARAEEASPGSATELLKIAKAESFHVLKDEARRTKLEAEQHRGLAERQRKARRASHHTDELGMVNIHMAWQPHIGAPIMARAEAEAQRLARAANKERRRQRALRALPRRRLRHAALWLRHGPGEASRGGHPREPRGRQTRVDRRQERRDVQDPRSRTGRA